MIWRFFISRANSVSIRSGNAYGVVNCLRSDAKRLCRRGLQSARKDALGTTNALINVANQQARIIENRRENRYVCAIERDAPRRRPGDCAVFIIRCALSCAPPSGDSDDVARDSFYRAFRLIPKGSISYASRRVCYSRRALSRGLKSAPARTSTTLRVVPVGSQARFKTIGSVQLVRAARILQRNKKRNARQIEKIIDFSFLLVVNVKRR